MVHTLGHVPVTINAQLMFNTLFNNKMHSFKVQLMYECSDRYTFSMMKLCAWRNLSYGNETSNKNKSI